MTISPTNYFSKQSFLQAALSPLRLYFLLRSKCPLHLRLIYCYWPLPFGSPLRTARHDRTQKRRQRRQRWSGTQLVRRAMSYTREYCLIRFDKRRKSSCYSQMATTRFRQKCYRSGWKTVRNATCLWWRRVTCWSRLVSTWWRERLIRNWQAC